jgi:molybdopterin converting factor small subunit
MTPEGALRPFVNVFVGVDSIKDRDGLATRVRHGDVVQIMAAVAGG